MPKCVGIRCGRSHWVGLRSKCRQAALCAAILLAPLALGAQQTTFHVDVKLVNIFVNVTDRNGAFVGRLTKDDFSIFEDGRPQQIASSSGSRNCL